MTDDASAASRGSGPLPEGEAPGRQPADGHIGSEPRASLPRQRHGEPAQPYWSTMNDPDDPDQTHVLPTAREIDYVTGVTDRAAADGTSLPGPAVSTSHPEHLYTHGNLSAVGPEPAERHRDAGAVGGMDYGDATVDLGGPAGYGDAGANADARVDPGTTPTSYQPPSHGDVGPASGGPPPSGEATMTSGGPTSYGGGVASSAPEGHGDVGTRSGGGSVGYGHAAPSSGGPARFGDAGVTPGGPGLGPEGYSDAGVPSGSPVSGAGHVAAGYGDAGVASGSPVSGSGHISGGYGDVRVASGGSVGGVGVGPGTYGDAGVGSGGPVSGAGIGSGSYGDGAMVSDGPVSRAGTASGFGDAGADPYGFGTPAGRRIEPSPPPDRSRLWMGLVAGLVVGLLVFGTAGFFGGRATAPDRPAPAPSGGVPVPKPSLGLYEQSQLRLNQPKFAGALTPIAQGWMPYLSGCERSGTLGGPVLNPGEKTRLRCTLGAMSVIFVEYATIADRDKARVNALGQNVDARTLTAGVAEAGPRAAPSGRTTGNYVEYAYRITEQKRSRTVSGIWWDDAQTPVGAYILAYWTEGVGESWGPMRDIWSRYA